MHVDENIETHPMTLCFVGRDDLEAKFKTWLAVRSVRTIQFLGVAFIALCGIYIYLDPKDIIIVSISSIAALTLGLLVLTVVYREFFIINHERFMTLFFVFASVLNNISVTSSGVFGRIIVQLLLVTVCNISNALHTVALSFFDLLVFVLVTSAPQPMDQLFAGEHDKYADYDKRPVFTPGQLAHNLFFLSFVITFLIMGFRSFMLSLRRAFLEQRDLTREKQRALDILDNMMPPHVRHILKMGPTSGTAADDAIIAIDEPEVSILFADVVSFSYLTAASSPSQLVSLLDKIWSLFDLLSQKHNVQKLETVGKTYMACAGIQGLTRYHAAACVDMGLEMIHLVAQVCVSRLQAL